MYEMGLLMVSIVHRKIDHDPKFFQPHEKIKTLSLASYNNLNKDIICTTREWNTL